MATVLAFRALGLGDTYAAVPALRALRRGSDGARLVLAGPPSWGALLVEQGVVDAVLPAAGLEPLVWEGAPPELVVNLHGSGPESHRLLSRLVAQAVASPERPSEPGGDASEMRGAARPAAAGGSRLVAFACPAPGFREGPAWDPDEHEVRRWIRLASELGGSASPDDLRLDPPPGPPPRAGVVVVHPGAAFGSRRWPVERWQSVAAELARAGLPVVVTGTAEESHLTRAVAEAAPGVADLGGRLTPRELAQLVGAARLLLSADTGLAHVATAYRTPSVTLFGPTDPAHWGPLVDPDVHQVLWSAEPGDPPGEPRGSRLDPRLARITADEVLARAETLLRRSPARPA